MAATTTAPPEPPAAILVRMKLQLWAEHLAERKAGTSNPILTLAEIRGQLDHWLDVLLTIEPALGPCQLVDGETTCRGCGTSFIVEVTP